MNRPKSFLCLLLVSFTIGSSVSGPTKTSDQSDNNEVDSIMYPVPVKEVVTNPKEMRIKSTEALNKSPEELIPVVVVMGTSSPSKNPPSFTPSENEPTFGAISGYGEGSFHNLEYGYAGKGHGAGIVGGVINDKGLAAGGAGYAAGIAGISTEPFKGFLGISTHQQGSFNTYGEKPESFTLDANKSEDEETEITLNEKNRVATSAVTSRIDKTVDETQSGDKEYNNVDSKAPTIPLANTVTNSHTINVLSTIFRPITTPLSPPALLSTLTGGLLGSKQPAEIEINAKQRPVEATEENTEEESGFYSFIRPLTPSGIASSVSHLLKPLTSLSGQALGSITLTGGASYTGTPPEKPQPVHVPVKPHHPEKPEIPHHFEKPEIPHHFEKPHHSEKPEKPTNPEKLHHHESPCAHREPPKDKLHECIALCHKKGKSGGSIQGDCCTCSCPAPDVPPGQLCCSGSNTACDTICTTNKFHKYLSGICNIETDACECRCSPWDNIWSPPQNQSQTTRTLA